MLFQALSAFAVSAATGQAPAHCPLAVHQQHQDHARDHGQPAAPGNAKTGDCCLVACVGLGAYFPPASSETPAPGAYAVRRLPVLTAQVVASVFSEKNCEARGPPIARIF